MNPKRPLGANTMSSYFKQFARKIGIDDWQSFGAHSLRAWFCTQMANSDVDIKTGMHNSRHESVSAYLGYVEPFKDEQRHKATKAMHNTPYVRAGMEKKTISKKPPPNTSTIASVGTMFSPTFAPAPSIVQAQTPLL